MRRGPGTGLRDLDGFRRCCFLEATPATVARQSSETGRNDIEEDR